MTSELENYNFNLQKIHQRKHLAKISMIGLRIKIPWDVQLPENSEKSKDTKKWNRLYVKCNPAQRKSHLKAQLYLLVPSKAHHCVPHIKCQQMRLVL